MNKYKVLQEFSTGPEEAKVIYEVGAIIELDPAKDDVVSLSEHGMIEAVVDEVKDEEVKEPVLVDYVVVNGPFANQQAEVFQTGNAIQFPEGDEFAANAVQAGLIMTKAAHDALPPKEEKVEEAAAPTAPAVAGSTEPRKRYRGKIVLVESDRVVGAQTFKHIRTEEGHEYDLTAAEYQTEVIVSYPPKA